MELKATGKTLLFTDIHFGLKGNSVSRLNIAVKAIKCMLDCIKKNDIKNVIFGGDLLHERVAINVNTMNVVLKCVEALARHCKVFLIIGNHDTHYKNSVDINSLNMFKSTKNVTIIHKAQSLELNGQKVLLAPWLSDFSTFTPEEFDLAVGHFDIPSKFLLATYIEEHSASKQTNIVSDLLESDSALMPAVAKSTTNADVKAAINLKAKSADLLKTFIDLVKKNGTIFSGHIHQHKEFAAKGRKFIFIGTPYQQTLGEMKQQCGYYVLDENNNYVFEKTVGLPIHVEVRMSKVLEDIDNYDFSKVRGNIVHKVYDCDVDRLVDAKVSQKIQDFKPYEELVPSYDASIAYGNDVKIESESIQLIKKSKLDYIRNYVDNIDKKALKEEGIDSDKLFKVLESYYNKVMDEQ